MGISFADAPTVARPSERSPRAPRDKRLRNDHHEVMPIELDLGDPASLASLRAIDIDWPQVPPEQRSYWLQNVRVALPVRPIVTGDIALLQVASW